MKLTHDAIRLEKKGAIVTSPRQNGRNKKTRYRFDRGSVSVQRQTYRVVIHGDVSREDNGVRRRQYFVHVALVLTPHHVRGYRRIVCPRQHLDCFKWFQSLSSVTIRNSTRIVSDWLVDCVIAYRTFFRSSAANPAVVTRKACPNLAIALGTTRRTSGISAAWPIRSARSLRHSSV